MSSGFNPLDRTPGWERRADQEHHRPSGLSEYEHNDCFWCGAAYDRIEALEREVRDGRDRANARIREIEQHNNEDIRRHGQGYLDATRGKDKRIDGLELALRAQTTLTNVYRAVERGDEWSARLWATRAAHDLPRETGILSFGEDYE